MGILRNGKQAEYRMMHDGKEMDRATHRSVIELWVKAFPYSVAFAEYPMQETASGNYSSKNVATRESGYSFSVKRASASNAFGFVQGKVSLPVQKCNRVQIRYSASMYAVARINGIALASNASDQYLTIACDGEEFELDFYVQDETAYFTSELTIHEIRFYYEL